MALALFLPFNNVKADGFFDMNDDSNHFFDSCCFNDFIIEAKVAAFFPTSKKVREIYTNVLADYEVEISKKFDDNWDIWLNASYIHSHGRSIGLSDRTTLRFMPFSLGVSYSQRFFCDFEAYIGAGVAYSFLRIHNDSNYVQEHISKKDFGGIFKSGIRYTSCDGIFVEGFFDYIYQKFNSSNSDSYSDSHYVTRHDADLSGYKVGVGLGFNF